MPLLLGLWNWERQYWWDLPPLDTLTIVMATLLACIVFEWGYAYWSTAFTFDWWDMVAYCAGSYVFWCSTNRKIAIPYLNK